MKQLQLFEKNQNERIKNCVFTGHRVLGRDFSRTRLKQLIKSLIERGVENFYNGVAMGFDLLAAEQVLSLKKQYPYIKLIACIPYYGQEKYFSQRDVKRYVSVLQKADEQILLSTEYYTGCLHNRDRYMVDNADVMIAYCNKNEGGAAYTLSYFRKKYPDGEVYLV